MLYLMIIPFIAFFSLLILFIYFFKASPKPFKRGLVIGKFYPPHNGHNLLIRTALKQCDSLVIIVCQKPFEKPCGSLRREFLEKIHGKNKAFKHILLIDDTYNQDDSELWAKLCLNWLKPLYPEGKKPLLNAVFTSEAYGTPFAKYLSINQKIEVKHILVDLSRKKVPISGSKIRETPYKYLHFLHPLVRNYYIKRIIFLGFPEDFFWSYGTNYKAFLIDSKGMEAKEWENAIIKPNGWENFVFSIGKPVLKEDLYKGNLLDSVNRVVYERGYKGDIKALEGKNLVIIKELEELDAILKGFL